MLTCDNANTSNYKQNVSANLNYTVKYVICHILLLLSFSVDICQQPLNLGVGLPFTLLDYYYYNSTNNTCGWFNYHGKGGNDNKFHNISSCQERCGMFYYALYYMYDEHISHYEYIE